MNTHWHLIKDDPTLSLFIDQETHVTFRSNQSLCDIDFQAFHYAKKSRSMCFTSPWHIPCGACNYCQFIKPGNVVRLPTGENLTMYHFVNCNAIDIDLLTCDFGRYYVGKTKRYFWKRIKDHVLDIKGGIT